MVERKSGYAAMAMVEKEASGKVSSAILDKLHRLPALVKTLTFYNGKEFAGHAYIDENLQSTAYFDSPFARWERESNENLNYSLRQYAPKKRTMYTVNDEEIRMIQNRSGSAKLNRPDKCIIGVFRYGKGAGAGGHHEQIIWAANPPRV